jgi:hypothetical protein
VFGNDADDAHRLVLGLMGWMLEGLDDAGRRRIGTLHAHMVTRNPRRCVLQSAAWTIRRPGRDHQASNGAERARACCHREAGPSWTDGKGAFDQPAVNDHGAFMNNLAAEGLVLSAGPLAGSERDRIRVLLIADAASEH